MSLNDLAWEKLFDEYNILKEIEEDGQFFISADKIRKYREPRLMTKFYHSINLPKIFSKNNLSILPVSRGDYVISSFDTYKTFLAPSSEIKRVTAPSYIQSLMPQYIVSEAIALNCASACNILKDFLEDEQIVPTVSGRMGSGTFDFRICTANGSRKISVNNSQIEIDAAYEGVEFLSLFEAKRDLSEDFLIRQLYYPFRTWSNRISKNVKTVFLVFSNGIFNLYEYAFDDINSYNSIRLVKQRNYMLATEICLSDIENILNEVQITEEPQISFPQANSMPRIINLVELLNEKPMTKQDITTEYAFDERQTNYYTDAGRYLGFINKGRDDERNILFTLSPLGRHIMRLEYRERQLAIVAQILKHRAFNETLKCHLQCGKMPDTNETVKIMKQANIYNVEAESTFVRRSSTITGWINWILDLVDD